MKEIRLCKSISEEIRESQHGLWMPESPAAREAFKVLAAAGNERYGPGTHWVEERHVQSPGASEDSNS